MPHAGALLSLLTGLLALICAAPCALAGQQGVPAQFTASIIPVPDTASDDVAALMRASTWRPGCPVGIEDLSYLQVAHLDMDDRPSIGELIVHSAVAAELVQIFSELWAAGFRIERMELIERAPYFGSDEASMAANNSSAFNCRVIAGSETFSRHSWGLAIDINPRINPWVKGEAVAPPEGRAFLERSPETPGLIVKDGPAYKAFVSRGWQWGGDWESRKDYQHFEKTLE